MTILRVAPDLHAQEIDPLSVTNSIPRLVPRAEDDDPMDRPEAAANARLTAAAQAVLDTEPPDDLKVDVRGLLPQRARLVRFEAWQADLKAKLDALRAGRERYLELLGVAVRTEAKIAEIVEADRTGLLDAMRAGGAFSPPKLRAHERAQLEAKLPADRHEAELAVAAVADAEREIAVLQKQIEVLAGRRQRFVYDALLEYAGAEGVGPAYAAAVEQVQDRMAELLGLAHVVGGHGGYFRSHRDEIAADVAMPKFNLPGIPGYVGETIKLGQPTGPRIAVTAARARKAAEPWAVLAKPWMSNACHQPANGKATGKKGLFR